MLTFHKTYLLAVMLTALASCTASITPNTGTSQPSPQPSSPQPSPTASAGTVSGNNSGTPVFDTVLTGNLNAYRGQNGKEVMIKTQGRTSGRVWGSETYTDDSDLGAAAVHAGLLKPGEEGIVRVEILPGQSAYAGITRNGVVSSDYGFWSGSFRFVDANVSGNTGIPDATNPFANQPIYKNPGTIRSFSREVGQQLHFEVTAKNSGRIWGTDVYTDDSNLDSAALHSGLLKENETGIVTIEVLPGQDSYVASLRNGVTSSVYGSWGGSFKFVGPARYVNNTGSLTIITNTNP